MVRHPGRHLEGDVVTIAKAASWATKDVVENGSRNIIYPTEWPVEPAARSEIHAVDSAVRPVTNWLTLTQQIAIRKVTATT